MANATFNAGTHPINDPASWTPGLPGPGDTGYIGMYSRATAYRGAIGPYNLVLNGASGGYLLPSVEGYQTTVTASISVSDAAYAYLDLIGSSTITGDITVDSGVLNLSVDDVVFFLGESDTTAPIQQGRLVNNGRMLGSRADSSLNIRGDQDAVIVNNGTIGGRGSNYLDAVVIGTGTILVDAQSAAEFMSVERAVGSGETVRLRDGRLSIGDPGEFRATIAGFVNPVDGDTVARGSIGIYGAVDAARFVDHTLVLTNGGQLVAELRFTADVKASDLLINASQTGVLIYTSKSDGDFSQAPPNVTVGTTGTVPAQPTLVVPAPPVRLPVHGPDLTFVDGYHIASTDVLRGYTIRLEGVTNSVSGPALDITSLTFGSDFQVRVEGAGASTRYGYVLGVGYNGNDGTITAATGTRGGAATLLLDIADIQSVLTGAFNNKGSIVAEKGSQVLIGGSTQSKLINAGTIVADGMVFIDTDVTGTGKMTVGQKSGAPGTLFLDDHRISTGQSIRMEAGLLHLRSAKQFYATIYDFDSKDSILISDGNVINSLAYNNGALSLNGGSQGTLHFRRPDGVFFDTGSFHLNHTPDGSVITLNP